METALLTCKPDNNNPDMLPRNISVLSFQYDNEVLFSQARRIREEVFIREQKVPEELEYEHDESAQHYLLFHHGEAKATGRWRDTGTGIKLERFAVTAEHRNKGYGTILLEKVLEDIIPKKQKIYLHSQITAVNYYLKAGFLCEGDIFYEAGIAHYLMIYSAADR